MDKYADYKEIPDSVIMSNHINEKYNGIYHLAEYWGEHPHWSNDKRTAHIYFYENKTENNEHGWWYIDDRE